MIASHILQLHLRKIDRVFCFLDKVFKIVHLKTPMTRGACLYLGIARKPLHDITNILFLSRQAQREIVTNMLITNLDTHRPVHTCQIACHRGEYREGKNDASQTKAKYQTGVLCSERVWKGQQSMKKGESEAFM